MVSCELSDQCQGQSSLLGELGQYKRQARATHGSLQLCGMTLDTEVLARKGLHVPRPRNSEAQHQACSEARWGRQNKRGGCVSMY